MAETRLRIGGGAALVVALTLTAMVWGARDARAVDLAISDASPDLLFDDTTSAVDDFSISANNDPPFPALFGFWRLRDGPLTVVSVVKGADSGNSLLISLAGNVSLADGAVFVDRSATRVGIGTTTPQANLHVRAPAGAANLWVEGPIAASSFRDLPAGATSPTGGVDLLQKIKKQQKSIKELRKRVARLERQG